MSKSRRKLGIWGENEAERFLIELGYSIIGRNVRTSYGEIDIVAHKDGFVVFIEVKTRTTQSFGTPEDSITVAKRERLIQSAAAYLQNHPEMENSWQIDVISIQKINGKPIQITHFENAINDFG